MVCGHRRGGQQVVEHGAEFHYPDACWCIGPDHRRPLEERAGHALLHLEVGQLDQVGGGGANLGEGDDAVPDPEQLEDA